MIRDPFVIAAKEHGHSLCDDEVDTIMYQKAEGRLNKEVLSDEDYQYKRLYIVHPRICNERISRQQGLFIIPSTIAMPFKEILREYCDMDNCLTNSVGAFAKMTGVTISADEIGLIKIIIPNQLRYDFTRALQMMNISAETMFPGLEGLGQSVNCLRNLSYEHSEGGIGVIR